MVDANTPPRWYRELCGWTPQHPSCRWDRSPLCRQVLNQGGNGWCWPIVVCEMISATHHLHLSRKQKNPVYTTLSFQELMDGVLWWNSDVYSFPLMEAFKWVKHFRLRAWDQYNWVGYKQEFRPKSDEEYIQAKHTTEFEILSLNYKNEKDIMWHLDNKGPIACEIFVSDEFLNLKEEIYEGSQNYYSEGERNVSHALILWAHGYDEERKQNYYVVKNSWGVGWGYSGFGRIACPSSSCFNGIEIDVEKEESGCLIGLAPYLIFGTLYPEWDVEGAPPHAPQVQNPPNPNICNPPSCGLLMKRGGSAGEAGGGAERVMNQFLFKMYGMSAKSTVSVIEATNRPDVIDSALLHPGHFDQLTYIPLPDEESHLQILKPCLRKSYVSTNVDIRALAKHTQGFKYAVMENSDLPAMSIEAALERNREKNVIYLENESSDAEILNFMAISNEHFATALGTSNPSAVRETVVEGGNVKRELQELIVQYPVQHPEKFEKFGISPLKGVLFFGPHGCGKTLLAKGIANECQANFVSVEGPELLTMWFGESEANAREIFDEACQSAPSVLSYDKLDSVATQTILQFQGKTLAFVLLILESIASGRLQAAKKTGYGRAPIVLVRLPTRELAKQVADEFDVYGGALGLSSCCFYGGASYHSQLNKMRRVVVIGTPGRVKDFIEREDIDFSLLKFCVLDEVDEILKMGFVEDVELILGKVEDVTKVQTLLFSATLPDWVKQIASRFLKSHRITVDLVGNEKMKASKNVRHILIPCHSARSQLIPDIVRSYSSGGHTIIFTETKDSVTELSGILPGACPLHGDIQQAQREVTLAGFRSGKFLTLVATNVAARGLDINDVRLIIQWIHRSGRTGRAGNTRVAVMLYDPRKSNVCRIERESGVKFEHLPAQPADIAKVSGLDAAETITQVSDAVIPIFKSATEERLNSSGLSAVELPAKSLAKTAGYTTETKSRSLLTSMENNVTLLLEAGEPIYTPSFAFSILKRFLPGEKVQSSVQGLTLTADGKGAVFDVPAGDHDTILAGQENAAAVSLEVVTTLPELQEREQSRGRFGNGGGSRFGGRGGGGFSDRRSDRFSGVRFGGRGRVGNNRGPWPMVQSFI